MKLLGSLLIAGLFCIASQANAEDYPSIEEIRQFLDGDSKLWPIFQQCAEEYASCGLIVGHVSLKSNELDQAERYFLSALQKGDHAAPWAMILLNIERNRPIETFVWSQLALAQLTENETERIEASKNSWPFIQLARAAKLLNDEQWAAGEQRSQELISQWLPVLQANSDSQAQYCKCESRSPVYQRPPRYPRSLANAGQPGWTLIDFAINEQGKVVDQIVILYSDARFARTSNSAIRKWEFEPLELTEHNQDCSIQRFRQTLDFQMER